MFSLINNLNFLRAATCLIATISFSACAPKLGASTAAGASSGKSSSASTSTPTAAASAIVSTNAVLTFSPASNAFGSITVGASSAAQGFTVTNSGKTSATNVYLALTTGTQYAVSGGTGCGTLLAKKTIATGATCTFNATFSPLMAGALSDTLTLTYDNGATTGVTATAALTGTGLSVASLSISDGATYGYGNVTIGSTPTHTFTVTNSGGSAATLGTLTTAGIGIAAPFTLTGGTCSTGGSVAASGGTCTMIVTYTPIGTGGDSATITLTYNNGFAAGQTTTRPITGTGLTVASLSISDGATYGYGNVIIGNTPTHTFTVTNSGGSAATLSTVSTAGIGIAAPFTLTGGTCSTGGSVAASGGTCTMIVTYTPTGTAGDSATITLTYNNGATAGQTTTRPITGTGLSVASLSISDSATYGYGSITIGNTPTHTFTVTNSGGSAATLGTLTTAGIGIAAPFTLTGGTCSTGGSVAASGGTCTMIVTYTPTGTGGDSATITLTYNNGFAAGQTTTRPITGTGLTVASLSFNPVSNNFGIIIVGASSGAQSFTITNSGQTAATAVYLGLNTGTQFSLPSGSNNCGVDSSHTVTIAASGTCTFTAVFSPVSSGTKSDTIKATFNNGVSGGQTQTAAISGTTPAIVAFSPTSKAFGSISISGSSTQNFTLTNSGGSTATSLYLSVSGAVFTLTQNNCGTASNATVSVAAGASCTFSIVFNPVAQIAYSETLTPSFNDGTMAQTTPTVALTGTGGAPILAANQLLWLKANTLGLTDGDLVSTWTDSSGNSNDAVTATTPNDDGDATPPIQPTYKSNVVNGYPAVEFSNILNTGLILTNRLTTVQTAFIVLEYDSTLANAGVLLNFFGDPTGALEFCGGLQTDTLLFDTVFNDDTNVANGAGYVNGTSTAPAVMQMPTSFSTISLVTTGNTIIGSIGQERSWWHDRGWAGDIVEIILYSSQLSDTDRQYIESYLRSKYGLP